MIHILLEMECDECGETLHRKTHGSEKALERIARNNGWEITDNDEHICRRCRE